MPSFRILDCGLATYSYAVRAFNPAAAATDIWVLAAVALKQIKPRWIELSGTAVAGRAQTVDLIKRSTANLTGTSTTPTPQKADSSDGAASAVITQYTVSPGTLGTVIGTVDAGSLSLVTANALQDRLTFNYADMTLKPLTLNVLAGSLEFLCVNFAGVATIATDKIDFSIWWTEQ